MNKKENFYLTRPLAKVTVRKVNRCLYNLVRTELNHQYFVMPVRPIKTLIDKVNVCLKDLNLNLESNIHRSGTTSSRAHMALCSKRSFGISTNS